MTNLSQQIKHVFKAYHNSIQGLKAAFHDELAFRQDVLMFILGIILAFIMPVDLALKLVLYSSLVFILLAELTNTAIEKTIDRISLEFHELSKKAKDIGSAIVFIALMNALFVWLLIFIKYVVLS